MFSSQLVTLTEAQERISNVFTAYAEILLPKITAITTSPQKQALRVPLEAYTKAFIEHASKLTYSVLYHRVRGQDKRAIHVSAEDMAKVSLQMTRWCDDILTKIFSAIKKTPINKEEIAKLVLRDAVVKEEKALCRALGCSEWLINEILTKRRQFKAVVLEAANSRQNPSNN